MKKALRALTGPFFGLLVVLSIYHYLKGLDTDYDHIIDLAHKVQKEHREYYDFYGEKEPDFPDKILNNQTMLGIDTNQNGVRDDIDVWINRTAYNKNENKAMRQYAKARQVWLLSCVNKALENQDILYTQLTEAQSCLEFISDYQRKVSHYAKERLNLLILNTPLRKNCHKDSPDKKILKFNTINSSSNFYCDFEIQYYDNVIFGNNEWKKSKK